jgi:hypothetical protein
VAEELSAVDPAPRIEAVLQGLRAGVRQRAAEAATLAAREEGVRNRLLELRQREHVQEPVPVSPRRQLGRAIVFARKAFFHLFLKWWSRPYQEQQNAFNQVASRLIQELVESHEATQRDLRRLEAEIARLEAALGEVRTPGAGPAGADA